VSGGLPFGVTPRRVFAGMFLACAALIGFALYLQHAQALEPCPMCILQRYAFIGIGLVALVGALHGPAAAGTAVYSGLVAVLAVGGGAVAAWHAWLQRFPPKVSSCGADLWYLLDTFPLSRALPAIFQGAGECSEVQWRFLGLSIPEWALVWFALFAVLAVLVIVRFARGRASSRRDGNRPREAARERQIQ